MSTRPSRTKETVEGDVKTIKRIVTAQIVIVIVVIAVAIVGIYFLYTYIASQISGLFGGFGLP